MAVGAFRRRGIAQPGQFAVDAQTVAAGEPAWQLPQTLGNPVRKLPDLGSVISHYFCCCYKISSIIIYMRHSLSFTHNSNL